MPFPDRAGAASSLLGICQMSFAAMLGIVLGQNLDGSALPLPLRSARPACWRWRSSSPAAGRGRPDGAHDGQAPRPRNGRQTIKKTSGEVSGPKGGSLAAPHQRPKSFSKKFFSARRGRGCGRIQALSPSRLWERCFRHRDLARLEEIVAARAEAPASDPSGRLS